MFIFDWVSNLWGKIKKKIWGSKDILDREYNQYAIRGVGDIETGDFNVLSFDLIEPDISHHQQMLLGIPCEPSSKPIRDVYKVEVPIFDFNNPESKNKIKIPIPKEHMDCHAAIHVEHNTNGDVVGFVDTWVKDIIRSEGGGINE